ncbi:metallophosphoesterase family protein [Limosilactobacillus pontis]|uniref:Metallophosphoesterase family protein n=1 Tax=Limosilactobacillus pontis TaxID=35787 RepID=A0ABT7V1F2_9LACO|nr:metallophosphoesterase family protein [Limosilactobacillus pontis]MDM8267137.1 metallophosphoesterase family protein [Limosilactobacillus pontis]
MKKKIAVFSDVHGNLTALQAMYQDSLDQGVDEYWFVGDLLMPGPSVNEIWALVQKMAPTVMVRGNWDDLVVVSARGQMDMEKPSHVYFGRLAQYVAEHAAPGLVDTLASWPLRVTRQVGSLNFGISHNLPDLNMGQALFPTNDSANFDQLFTPPAGQPDIDVAIYAHVHHDLFRYGTDERIILNPGAVGEPFNHWPALQNDLRAHYLILEVDDLGMAVTSFRHVAYDREREKVLADKTDLPYRGLYQKMMDTGLAYTHDDDLLRKYNDRYHYIAEYERFKENLNK